MARRPKTAKAALPDILPPAPVMPAMPDIGEVESLRRRVKNLEAELAERAMRHDMAVRESEADPDDLQAAVAAAYADAREYHEHDIQPFRDRSVAYYKGLLFEEDDPDAQQGATYIEHVVREGINSMMPSLINTLAPKDRLFRYAPRSGRDVSAADAATEAGNYAVFTENKGYEVIYSAIRDGLLEKNGAVKFWWEDVHDVSYRTITGLSRDAVELLSEDPEVTILSEEIEVDAQQMRPGFAPMMDPAALPPEIAGMMPPGIVPTDVNITVRVRRTRRFGQIRIVALPPEELIWSRSGRDIENAPYVAHRTHKTISELVAMGYDRDEIEDHASKDGNAPGLGLNDIAEQLRNPANYISRGDAAADPSMRTALYVEHYIRFDGDGDGIAELHRVCTIGQACHVLDDEIVPDVPFAIFPAYLVPHEIIGESVADSLMDLQRTISQLMRDVLDSAAMSNYPRFIYQKGAVDVEDLQNDGPLIGSRDVNAVRPLETQFLGQGALLVISRLEEQITSRTGMSKASAGLDPDALQSTSVTAVNNTIAASEMRLMLIARNMAEVGVKSLAKGILRLICRHQDQPRTIRSTNQDILIDPRDWDAEMHVLVDVALGKQEEAKRLAALQQVQAKQEYIMTTLGPTNPLVTPVHWLNTETDLLKMSGMLDVDRYFAPITPEIVQQYAAQQAQNKPADPNQMLAQVEMDKAKLQAQVKQQEQQIKLLIAQMEDARAREDSDKDFAIAQAEIAGQYGRAVDTAQIAADAVRDRQVTQAMTSFAQHITPQTPPPGPSAPPPGPEGVPF